MNKSLFGVIVVLSVAAAITFGVATGRVAQSWLWGYFGLNIVWGYVGLAFALLVTYPVLRRWDIVGWTLGIGWLCLAFGALFPAFGYQQIQLWRDGVTVIDARDLGRLPHDHPVNSRLDCTDWQCSQVAHLPVKPLEERPSGSASELLEGATTVYGHLDDFDSQCEDALHTWIPASYEPGDRAHARLSFPFPGFTFTFVLNRLIVAAFVIGFGIAWWVRRKRRRARR